MYKTPLTKNKALTLLCVNLNVEEKKKKKIACVSTPRTWKQSMKFTLKYSKEKI